MDRFLPTAEVEAQRLNTKTSRPKDQEILAAHIMQARAAVSILNFANARQAAIYVYYT